VHPYRRPLEVTRDGKVVLVEPEELGGRWAPAPLPVSQVLLTRFEPGARFAPRDVTLGQAVVEVFGHTLDAIFWPRRAMRRLIRLLAGVRVLKGPRPEADAVAARIIEAVEERE
jgi:hypothetical protein